MAAARQGTAPTAFTGERTIGITRRCGPKTQDSTRYEPVLAAIDRNVSPMIDACFIRTSATARQSCEHLRACYRSLTRLFKSIATARWQGCGNRAATARGEFRGGKWKAACPLPGRAVPSRLLLARL